MNDKIEHTILDEETIIIGLLFGNTRELLDEMHLLIDENSFNSEHLRDIYIKICNEMDSLGTICIASPSFLEYIYNYKQKKLHSIEKFRLALASIALDSDKYDKDEDEKSPSEIEVDKIFEFSKSLSSLMRELEYFGQFDYALYAQVMSDCYKLQASLTDWESHIDDD